VAAAPDKTGVFEKRLHQTSKTTRPYDCTCTGEAVASCKRNTYSCFREHSSAQMIDAQVFQPCARLYVLVAAWGAQNRVGCSASSGRRALWRSPDLADIVVLFLLLPPLMPASLVLVLYSHPPRTSCIICDLLPLIIKSSSPSGHTFDPNFLAAMHQLSL
jgi:hypothetical protein